MTEAVRGEGGRLFNALGERYMERYDPERLELSSRDRVALANYTEIASGRAGPHGGEFLDISHRGREHIADKLPRMYRQFIEWQMLDISREAMEVAPTAHYSMGGIVANPEIHAGEAAAVFAPERETYTRSRRVIDEARRLWQGPEPQAARPGRDSWTQGSESGGPPQQPRA